MIDHNTIVVNGKEINFTGNAIINIKKDTSSEKEKKFDTDNKSRMIIEIEGDVGDIICDDANILINGNANRIITKSGHIKCENINGKVVCMSLETNSIKGYVNTNGDIITNTFIGNTSVGKVIDNFKPVKNKSELKEKMVVYHKKYGKGKITSMYSYAHSVGGGNVTISFDSEEFSKHLQMDKVINNKSLSIYNEEIEKEYQEEFED